MAKPKYVTLTFDLEVPPGYDNAMISRVVKPELELAVKKAAPAGVRVLRTVVAKTKA